MLEKCSKQNTMISVLKIPHLFFSIFKTKIMVLCFGPKTSIYLPEISQCSLEKDSAGYMGQWFDKKEKEMKNKNKEGAYDLPSF